MAPLFVLQLYNSTVWQGGGGGGDDVQHPTDGSIESEGFPWEGLLLKSTFEALSTRLAPSGYQPVDLPSVGGLIALRERSGEGGVIQKLQEFNRLTTGVALVCVDGGSHGTMGTTLKGAGAK